MQELLQPLAESLADWDEGDPSPCPEDEEFFLRPEFFLRHTRMFNFEDVIAQSQ